MLLDGIGIGRCIVDGTWAAALVTGGIVAALPVGHLRVLVG
jgi:hypothetical protein